MARKSHNPNPNGRRGIPVSLASPSPDQALAELLRVKPADAKKIEAAERSAAITHLGQRDMERLTRQAKFATRQAERDRKSAQ